MSQDKTESTMTLDRDKLNELRDYFEDDPAFVPEMLEIYLADTKKVMAPLRQAVEASDTEALRKIAHKLKGSSSNVGAHRMVKLCKTLEELGKAGENEGAVTLLLEAEAEFEKLVIEIRKELQSAAA